MRRALIGCVVGAGLFLAAVVGGAGTYDYVPYPARGWLILAHR